MPTTEHPGHDRTLAAASRVYYWPTTRVDIDRYVAHCISCAKYKSKTKGSGTHAAIPTTRMSVGRCFNRLTTVTKESFRLTIPPSVCIGHFSRFVVLAPVRNKTAASVAHALETQLHCPYATPRILLSDNGVEIKNAILAEIFNQYITQTFTVAYHPASNGLFERANRTIFDALCPVVSFLFENWEDWIPQISACLNHSVCESTGKALHYILYGFLKRLSYDLFSRPHKPVYDIANYAELLLVSIIKFLKNWKLPGMR